MQLEDFKRSIAGAQLPEGLPPALAALWHDGRGDWDKAHDVAQDLDNSDGAWIHAYLHRKEGDQGNAAYWYRRAGKSFPSDLSLEEEWEAMTAYFLRSLKFSSE